MGDQKEETEERVKQLMRTARNYDRYQKIKEKSELNKCSFKPKINVRTNGKRKSMIDLKILNQDGIKPE